MYANVTCFPSCVRFIRTILFLYLNILYIKTPKHRKESNKKGMVYLSLHIPCPFDMVPRAASDVFRDSRDALISEQNLVWLWIKNSFHAHAYYFCFSLFAVHVALFSAVCFRKSVHLEKPFYIFRNKYVQTHVLLYMVKCIRKTFWRYKKVTRTKRYLSDTISILSY